MKKFCIFLKYVMIASLLAVAIRFGIDLFRAIFRPETYVFYSAPWYTGALVYAVFFGAVILVCAVVRGILLRKIRRSEAQNADAAAQAESDADVR